MLQHYDELPDYLVFVQGDPFPHMFENVNMNNFLAALKRLLSTWPEHLVCLFDFLHVEPHGTGPSIKSKEYFELLFDARTPKDSVFPPGTHAAVPREVILSKPKRFYAHIQSLLLHGKQLTLPEAVTGDNPFDPWSINGWTLERLWMYVFDASILRSKRFSQKRYLVTGGAGFIGSNLVRVLQDSNIVIVLDNLVTGNLNSIPSHPNVFFIKGDILSKDDLYMAGQVDGIFHLAAISKVAPSMMNPEMLNYCMKNNMQGTISVLNYAAHHRPPVKVIYSASSTAYGSNNIPHHELLPPDLGTPYALLD